MSAGRIWGTIAAIAVAAAALSAPAGGSGERFRFSISPIGPQLAARMTGVSWRAGCPVHLRDLRLIHARHWGFDRKPRTGVLVVHEDVDEAIVAVLRRLYAERFPIRRMRLVDAYGASDFRSIEADNTSAFNCRPVAGTSRWSQHAYGRAIDVNPIENPYVASGRTAHRASVPYVDRSRRRPGMAFERGALVRAFDAIGWGWGGRWAPVKDYQHFSRSGR